MSSPTSPTPSPGPIKRVAYLWRALLALVTLGLLTGFLTLTLALPKSPHANPTPTQGASPTATSALVIPDLSQPGATSTVTPHATRTPKASSSGNGSTTGSGSGGGTTAKPTTTPTPKPKPKPTATTPPPTAAPSPTATAQPNW